MKRQNELHCRVLATNVIEFFGLRLVIDFSRTARQGRGCGRRPWARQTAADRAPWSRLKLVADWDRMWGGRSSRSKTLTST